MVCGERGILPIYANRKHPDADRMHTGLQNLLHTPFPDRWGFELSIDYQRVWPSERLVFTKCLRAKNRGDLLEDKDLNKLFHRL